MLKQSKSPLECDVSLPLDLSLYFSFILRMPDLGSSRILGECKNRTVWIRGLRFIPEGCQKIAGGRSAAETPGKFETKRCIPQGCQNPSIRHGKQIIASGIPPGCDLPFALIRWSALRCDHRLLSAIPSGMNRNGGKTRGEFIPSRFPLNQIWTARQREPRLPITAPQSRSHRQRR